jgi:hypothetical protein
VAEPTCKIFFAVMVAVPSFVNTEVAVPPVQAVEGSTEAIGLSQSKRF